VCDGLLDSWWCQYSSSGRN